MTYVLSDIHGDMDAFDSILSQINLTEQDHLYIIGDVIDRGEHSIELLQRIRKMPNATLLLGNHELMMLNRLRNPESMHLASLWYNNEGNRTERQYYELSESEQQDLRRYLESLPTEAKVEVNRQIYVLVHACPQELYDVKKHRRLFENQTQFAVWMRIEPDTPLPENMTVVFGHTPTDDFQTADIMLQIFYGERRIGIDCGCAFPDYGGRLACLRLDDMHEFYSTYRCVDPEQEVSLSPVIKEDAGFIADLNKMINLYGMVPVLLTDKTVLEDRIAKCSSKNHEFLILLQNRKIGHSSLKITDETAEIRLILNPRFCREGFGTMVMQLLIRKVKKYGVHVITATTDAENRAMIHLLENHNFVRHQSGFIMRPSIYEDKRAQPEKRSFIQYTLDLT